MLECSNPISQTARVACLLVVAILATASISVDRVVAATDLILRGVVHDSDNQSYIPVLFDVPKGATKVSVDLNYQGRDQGTILNLEIRDPQGLRGSGGGGKRNVVLTESFATPSFLPGPILAGRWQLRLWVANIRKDVSSPFEAHIKVSGAEDADSILDVPVKAGPGWYRGDLHSHTGHSDATCANPAGRPSPCPVFLTLEAARLHGLDFLVITDHNATSHYAEMATLAPYFDTLLLIPGREITTRQGHFNLIGATRFVDFSLAPPGSVGGRDMNSVLKDARATQGLISINHPSIPTDENCLGCGWSAPNTDFDLVNMVEVANGGIAADQSGFPEGALSGIGFWQALLDAGRHVTGVGGSDNHDPVDGSAKSPVGRQSPVGTPTTVVYADDLSQAAVLRGLRSGRVFIDLENRPNRLLDVSATSGGARAQMGGVLAAACRAKIDVETHLVGLAGDHPDLVVDGKSLGGKEQIRADDQTIILSLDPGQANRWLRMDVRNATGSRILIGNPIYIKRPAKGSCGTTPRG